MTDTRDYFVPITGKPSHVDVVCIRKALTAILLQAGYDKAHAKHNLWVIISPQTPTQQIMVKLFLCLSKSSHIP